MSVDMSQFIQTFFEESFEGLDLMEAGLLGLDGSADPETVNSIFRAAHSIKGGGATFGFSQVSEFTHGVETLLDRIRSNEHDADAQTVSVLLQTVDCLREMLNAARQKEEYDQERAAGLAEQVNGLLGKAPGNGEGSGVHTQHAPAAGESIGWRISFKPFPYLMRTGNDPVRMLGMLASMGSYQVTVDTSQVPAFEDLDPEECHLAWQIELRGTIPREEVDEVFSWVEEDCELAIEPIAAATPGRTALERDDTRVVNGELVEDRRTGKDRRQVTERRLSNLAGDKGSIRVSIDKVDDVINLVGELVTTQSMLANIAENFETAKLDLLREAVDQLELNTHELQESIMRIRMMPISFVFARYPRMVHDLGQTLGKKIELQLEGEQTELDKTVIEKIADPMTHLVRNSVDHGIEIPEVRRAAGKSETGTLVLNAYHKGGNIVIEITDDGKGLDAELLRDKAIERGLIEPNEELSKQQIFDLIFLPGFSTATAVSDLSGRGVGMDVVRRNIQSLNGTIRLDSEKGKFTRVTIQLPLTLAILEGQLISVGDECYIVPLVSIIESLQARPEMVSLVAGKGEVFRFREEFIPIMRLHRLFDITPHTETITEGLLVVVESDGEHIALFVDDLLGQQQVAIKSLENNYEHVAGVSGATILGDGRVALILDVPGLLRLGQLH